ncbi:CpaE family protein [Cellulomonas sp. 179-A 4D5 NHS]|uniref:AAA family ATPase n=1 Tax=Cellulomonas sp. 179-A 4D5 NHS TaxID=3142378 RepID=UPI00399F503E
MAVGVLCAIRGASEAGIVQAVDGTAGRLSVTRRCADLTELLAAAEAGLGRVALVSTDLPMLDREAVAALHRCGVRVVGLGDPALPWQGERAVALGVDLVVDAPEDGTDATAFVRSVVALLERGASGGTDTLAHAPAELSTPGPEYVAPDGHVPRPEPSRLVAVWGPTGAPGRTTLAINLAAEIALLGRLALLVDADTYGGTVAQAVGLLDEAPGIAAAARAAGQGTLDVEHLARLTPLLAPGLRVLSGVSRADRWPELPTASLEVVWTVARALSAWTVVDCGFSIEQDEVLSYDTHAPHRNAATLSALQEADEVVVVGAGDPIGVQRLVRSLGELAELGLTGRRTVVVNKVRASVAGPRPEEAIASALERYAGVQAPVLVADDRQGTDAALLEARLLHELVPGSPARRAIAALAAQLVGGGLPAGGPEEREGAAVLVPAGARASRADGP